MKLFNFNKSQDLIAIIAPASKCSDADLKLKEVEQLLETHGFKYRIADNIFDDESLPFVAAAQEIRINSLKEALYNPEVKIILAFRGGYGCTEIVQDCINFKPVGQKTLIGFSDITALHILFNESYNIPTIHGSALTNILKSNDFEDIIKVLSGEKIQFELQKINGSNHIKPVINGLVTGGNLTIFCNMIGTKLAPQTKDKILIFEDVNEKGYQVHRHLIHLKNAGLLNNVGAVIFGDFLKTDQHLEVAINHFCLNHIPDIPTFRATGIGHGEINRPFIVGISASIKEDIFTQESIFKFT